MSFDLNSHVELYDTDILAIEAGPLKYAQDRAGKTLDIDRFTKDLAEQFAQIGLGADVQVHTTAQTGVWAFVIEIQRRLDESPFDFDRMVHEVTNNVLALPGQEGFINTSQAMNELLRKERAGELPKHKHG